MKHQFFFSGYSDDVVLAGGDKQSFDEHYRTFYLLSNGMVIKADFGNDGWKIEPTNMPAEGVTIIPAVDLDDNGKDHDDPRIPDWFEAQGHAPVCIIESDEPLELVASSDRLFGDNSPEFMAAARLRAAVVKSTGEDDCECPGIEHFKVAVKKCGLFRKESE